MFDKNKEVFESIESRFSSCSRLLKQGQHEKQLTTLMKGYAILFIMLHNFFHLFDKYFQENEMSLDTGLTCQYISQVFSGGVIQIPNFFSFLGWIGVPVFIFLSGYGLERKRQTIGIGSFSKLIKHSFVKLIRLILPGVLFFFIAIWLREGIENAIKHLMPLTLLNNLFLEFFPLNPGVYWYFGLAFELYCLFPLFSKLKTKTLLIFVSIGYVLQMIVFQNATESLQSLYMHNATGWFQIFLLGIICGRHNILAFNNLPPPHYCLSTPRG